jgi:hypothetical protein
MYDKHTNCQALLFIFFTFSMPLNIHDSPRDRLLMHVAPCGYGSRLVAAIRL